ncbi:MAG TPA: peptidylprolyl isomerase, partial [Thermoguttaceae bacterium]|nr:peptidylprolyl isomerase [Thermoguttaceae bacterium]
TRHDLGRECLRHYGEEVLDSYVNKRVIAMECAAQGVQITRQDVEAEIDRMAKHFNLSVQQWYKMLQEERGINPEQYAADIVWPTLALRRLAADRLQVSEAELRAAYETQFGPAVKARLIACKEAAKARQLHAQVAAKPDDFGRVAKKESDDAPSASDMGWIPPIRRHGGPKEIEQAAFALRDGEISPVIPVSGQYVILKREKGLEARDVPFDQVAPQLKQMLEERKVRGVAGEVFRELKKKAHCEIHFGDPRYANSGIAAVINGEKITMGQLQDACIERHGKEVLEGTINRRLIEQACKKSKVVVTKEELAEEVRRAAEVSVPPKADGTPDVESWIKLVTEKQGVSYEVYMHDSVWPSVALRKLAGDQGAVTEEDIRRGFEANYGPRVRCLAAVFSDLRLTQRIWKMAREKHQTLAEAREKQVASGITAQQADGLFFDTFNDFFGDLAEQYSIEPGSRKLRGQVPPIKKWGGQPILEKEAFALSPGELSGIIQVGDKFVVLFCQGLTDPVNVDPASVRELILEDLREKKLHAAMATYFQRLQDFATIDNYLAGTSQSPQEKLRGGATLPDLQQVPTRQ